MIRAVTFDFWGTLYTEGPPAERRRLLRYEYAKDFFIGIGADVSRRQLEYAFEIVYHDVEHFRMVEHAGLSGEDIGQRLGRTVGVRLGAAEALRLGELISSATREAPPVPVGGAREVLQSLRGKVKLGLISDTGFTLGHDLYAVMEADGVAQLLDAFTFSNQTQTTKPEVRQFHHTLHQLRCSPEQGVHVGDLEPTDVAGAKAAGMRAIRMVGAGADPATAADAAIEDIAEVPGVLRGWGLALSEAEKA